ERREADQHRALAVMHEFVRSQGDGWSHALSYLDRIFDAMRELPAGGEDGGTGPERNAIYYAQIKILARRVAEMHRALAQPSNDPAFAPEPITASDRKAWR